MPLPGRRYEETLAGAMDSLQQLMRSDGWLGQHVHNIEMRGRTKSIHSTWRKIERRGTDLRSVHDLIALRVVIEPRYDSSLSQVRRPHLTLTLRSSCGTTRASLRYVALT
jgi:ppGpp synthetase/RelA/SpoT-type nucleotidyltranferase